MPVAIAAVSLLGAVAIPWLSLKQNQEPKADQVAGISTDGGKQSTVESKLEEGAN